MHDADVTPFLPLVHRLAARLARRAPGTNRDDLFSDGLLGLVQGLQRRPDGLTGEELERYLTRRVKGAMLDGARAASPAFRQLRAARRAHGRAVAALGGDTSPARVAERLGMSADAYESHQRFLAGEQLATHSEYDDAVAVREDDDVAEQWGKARDLARAWADLPETLRATVELHFVQGLSNRDIARKMGVHESRISQLHRKAIDTLQARLDHSRVDSAA